MRVKPVDHSNAMSDFMTNQQLEYFLSQFYCNMLCKVVSYKSGAKEAKIKPLPKQSDGKERPNIPAAIVPESIIQQDKIIPKLIEVANSHHAAGIPKWKKMKVGSVVEVAFMDREIDGYKGNSTYSITSHRMHALTDAVIVRLVKS